MDQVNLNLDITSPLAGEAKVEIMDLQGRVLLTSPVSLQLGMQRLTFDAGHCAQGLYVVKLTQGTSSVSKKFGRL
jgi:hypothetical protein